MNYELAKTRCFLVTYVSAFVALFCCSRFGLNNVVMGFFNVPTTGFWSEVSNGQSVDLTPALTVLASVAVVVWTGGLVALQLQKADLKTSFAMDLLGICFIGCTLTIVAHWSNVLNHHALRYVATLFALRYLYIYANTYMQAVRKEPQDRVNMEYATRGISLMPLYALVIAFPIQNVVAWISAGTLYFGLWYVLRSLQNKANEKPTEVVLVGIRTEPPAN